MAKRNLLVLATTISALLFASFAAAQRSRLDDLTQNHHLSQADAAATIVLADALHMSERDIVYSAQDAHVGVFDMAPAFVIAHYADTSVDRVWRQRDGRKWLDYADDLRMNFRDFNKLDVHEDNFDRMMWVNLLNAAYGYRPAVWDDLRDRGLSEKDALVAVLLGEGDVDRCTRIYTYYVGCGYAWGPVFAWYPTYYVEYAGGPFFGFGAYWDGLVFWGGGFGIDYYGGYVDHGRYWRGRDGYSGGHGSGGYSGRGGRGSDEPGLYDSRSWGSSRNSDSVSGGRSYGGSRGESSDDRGRSSDGGRSSGRDRSGGDSGGRGGRSSDGGGHSGGHSSDGGGRGR